MIKSRVLGPPSGASKMIESRVFGSPSGTSKITKSHVLGPPSGASKMTKSRVLEPQTVMLCLRLMLTRVDIHKHTLNGFPQKV